MLIASLVLLALMAGVSLWAFREMRRHDKRRRSLRKEGAVYVWTDFDGTRQHSETHPDTFGGAWYDPSRDARWNQIPHGGAGGVPDGGDCGDGGD